MVIKAMTYEECFTSFKKGLRNGNWRKERKGVFAWAPSYGAGRD